MDKRRQKTGGHNFIVTTAKGQATPLTSAIGYMVFLVPQQARFQTKEGEDSHLPGELIIPSLKMGALKMDSSKLLSLRHQH